MTAAGAAEPARPDGPEKLVGPAFLLATAITFVFFTAVGLCIPVLPRFTEHIGGDDLDVGTLSTVYAVAAVLCRPLVVRAARRGDRFVIALGCATATVGFGLHAVATTLPLLWVARAVVAVGEALQFTGFTTLVNDLAPPHRRAEATSYSSVALFIGLGVGPLLGEVLAGRRAYVTAFFAAAACTVGAGLLCARLPRPVPTPHDEVNGTVFHRGALATGFVLACVMAGYVGWSSFLALRTDELGLHDAGRLFLLYSIVVLVIRLVGARIPERIGLVRCTTAAIASTTAGLALLATVDGRLGLVLGTIAVAIGMALIYPSLSALTIARNPDRAQRAAVVGTFTMFFEVGSGIGGVLLGAVARAHGYQIAFAAGAGLVVAGLAGMRPLARPV